MRLVYSQRELCSKRNTVVRCDRELWLIFVLARIEKFPGLAVVLDTVQLKIDLTSENVDFVWSEK